MKWSSGLLLCGFAAATGATGDAHASPAPVCDGQFHFVDVPGTECLDGSPTGLVYRCVAASGPGGPLIINVDGGGACWDHDSCDCGPDTAGVPGFDSGCPPNLQTNHFGPGDVAGYVDAGFESQEFFQGPTSAFDGWNQVFLPYCTGDVHSGRVNRDFGDYTAHFKGYSNMTRELAVLRALFPSPSRVAELGTSGGAFGEECNLSQLAASWPRTPKYAVGFGEVPFDSRVVPLLPAATQTWGAIHRRGNFYVADTCPFADSAVYQFHDIERHNRLTLPEVRKGIAAFESDETLDGFACALGATPDASGSCARALQLSLASALENGILDAPGVVDPTYKAFFVRGTCHDFVDDTDESCQYDSISSHGVMLNDWIRGWMQVPGFAWPMAAGRR